MLGCGILCSYSWCHDSGFLRRVGLDVFEDEPKMKPGLAECDNAVIVPHIASASFWTRSAMVCTPYTLPCSSMHVPAAMPAMALVPQLQPSRTVSQKVA